MLPYVSSGIQNVDRIVEIHSKSADPTFKTKIEDVEPIIKMNTKDTISEGIAKQRINNFSNTNNFEVMRNIVADRMKIPPERRNDVNVVQQINQQVNQDFKDGAKYITSGAAKDPETLNRLLELERKIDKKIDMGGSVGTPKATYVVNADKAIQKAIKDNLKSVKLPGAKSNLAVAELQKVLNNELKARKQQMSNSSTSSNSRTSTRQVPSSNSNTTPNSSPSTRQIPGSNSNATPNSSPSTRQVPSSKSNTTPTSSTRRRPRQTPPSGTDTNNLDGN